MALHDHVYKEFCTAHLFKDIGRDARPVGQIGKRDERLRRIQRDILHGQILHAFEPADHVQRARLGQGHCGPLGPAAHNLGLQAKRPMRCLHGRSGIVAVNEHRYFDLTGCDHPHVDSLA